MISRYVFVSSKDRDTSFWPEPSDYVVKIDPPIKHVTSIELIHFAISNIGYTLQNNRYIKVNNETCIFPDGIYSSTEMCAVLQDWLQQTFPDNYYWSVRVIREHMSIQISAQKEFIVNETSLPCTFPTTPSTPGTDGWYTIKSTILDLRGDKVVMNIKNLGTLIEPNEGGYASFDTFTTFQLKAYPGEYVIDEAYTPLRHDQNPMTTIDRMHITFNQPMLDHACIFRILINQ
jgi:hypothetical protein